MDGTSIVLAPSVQELALKMFQNNIFNQIKTLLLFLTQLYHKNFQGKLLCEDANELEKLDNACKDWGFFQV
jgi:hypothetical protein